MVRKLGLHRMHKVFHSGIHRQPSAAEVNGQCFVTEAIMLFVLDPFSGDPRAMILHSLLRILDLLYTIERSFSFHFIDRALQEKHSSTV